MPTLVIIMVKIPTIQVIFHKYKGGNYTSQALMYQDILRYSVAELDPSKQQKSQCSFTLWGVTEWLISHNLEIANEYKNSSAARMTKTNKIQARMGRVKRYIDTLICLGLISEMVRIKETKGEGLIPMYSFTEYGFIVASLIMTLYPDKRLKAINFIHKLFCKNFENNLSSYDRLSLILTNKLVNNGLFERYIDALVTSMEKNVSISDTNNIFDNAVIDEFDEKDFKKYIVLKKEAFDELNPEMKKYLMHKQKLGLERKMFGVSNNLGGFEKMSFELRNDYETFAAEGHCETCKLYFPLGLSLQEYLTAPYEIFGKCPSCNKNSLLIPTFDV